MHATGCRVKFGPKSFERLAKDKQNVTCSLGHIQDVAGGTPSLGANGRGMLLALVELQRRKEGSSGIPWENSRNTTG